MYKYKSLQVGQLPRVFAICAKFGEFLLSQNIWNKKSITTQGFLGMNTAPVAFL